MHHIRNLTALIFVLVVVFSTAAFAEPTAQWAVTSSFDKLFLVKHASGSMTSYQVAEFSGLMMTGVGTYNGYVFVADTISVSGKSSAVLRVGKITDPVLNPTIEWIGAPITLAQDGEILKQPTSLAVSANGGIYVMGGRYVDNYNQTHSNYAYITSSNGWQSAQVSVVNLPSTSLADVAPSGNGAVFAHRNLREGFVDQTWVTTAIGASSGFGKNLEDTGYLPAGIVAGTNGYTYVANRSTEDQPGAGPDDIGSISVMDSATQTRMGPAFQLDDFRPTDIAYFSSGEVNYLGLVGDDGGLIQAIRVTLGEDGMPLMDSLMYQQLDASTKHQCAISEDGKFLWVTNTQSNTVTALDTSSWTAQTVGVSGAAEFISAFMPVGSIVIVPEPASVLALLTGVISLASLKIGRRSNRKYS